LPGPAPRSILPCDVLVDGRAARFSGQREAIRKSLRRAIAAPDRCCYAMLSVWTAQTATVRKEGLGRTSRCGGGRDRSRHAAKADRSIIGTFSPRRESDCIAVLEKAALPSGRQFQRCFAARGDFHEAADAARLRPRNRALPQQVARLQVAAIGAV